MALCFLTVTGNAVQNQPSVVLINHRTSVSVNAPIWAPFVDWCVRACVHPRALALWHLCYIINLKGLDNKLQVHGRQAEGAGVVVVVVVLECMRGRVKDCV